MTTLLELRAVTKTFGGVRAVSDLTLAAEEGQVTGLIGPNGAGKSTVIDLVSGMLRVDSGAIRFAGEEIQSQPLHRVSRLGLMRSFQVAREWPKFTVLENLLVAAIDRERTPLWRAIFTPGRLRRAQDEDRIHARELMDEFDLLDLRDAPAGTLSGGQKRLLEFARLVMAKPRMVLLDEPLAGVNPVMGLRIQAGISALVDRGISVLLVEHDLRLVEALCSTVTVLALGSAIASGPMHELRANTLVGDAYLGINA